MRFLSALTGSVLLAACASVPPTDIVEDMMAADRLFAAQAAEEGVPAAFGNWAAEDVQMFPDGGQPYAGRDQLVSRFADWPEGATLSWEPVEGTAAASGDLGFTWGRFVMTLPDGRTEHGKYVSVWEKQDGEWKFVADIGNSNPAPE